MIGINRTCRCLWLSLFAIGYFVLGGMESRAEETPEIKAAIEKGAVWLRKNINSAVGGYQILMAYALLKAGDPPTSAELAPIFADIKNRCRSTGYSSGDKHVYQAGVEAMMLSDKNPEAYRDQLNLIAKYIQSAQKENGSWDYPFPRPSQGDTSVTQYGCLGLWAFARAGGEVPHEVWEKTLQWHLKTQNSDGGFTYTPGGKPEGFHNVASELNMSLAGLGSMQLCAMHLFPGASVRIARNEETTTPRKFGVLEQVGIDRGADAGKPKKSLSALKWSEVASAITKNIQYVSSRYQPINPDDRLRGYYYYTLERAITLSDLTKIGDHKWFEECAATLIRQQKEDGSWHLSSIDTTQGDTSFAVIYLSRPTAKLLNRPTKEISFGSGLLKGGRGLPENLADVRSKTGEAAKAKATNPLDGLLASLQEPEKVSVEELQEQIVDAVQLGDKKELVGNIPLLLKLVNHPDAEVRRTGVWAIGRTDTLSLGKFLILALDDNDPDVLTEAQLALCWLSHRPLGFNLPLSPLDGLGEDAGADQKQAAINSWRSQALRAWGTWYLDHRPFAERGDDFEVELREKLKAPR